MSDENVYQSGLFQITEPVILSHPNLAEMAQVTRNGKPTGEPKYSAAFVMEKDGNVHNALKAKLREVSVAKWGKNIPANLKSPIKEGDKLADDRKAKSGKDDGDYQRGKIVLHARTKQPVWLGASVNGKVTEFPQTEANKSVILKTFFFGAEVLADVIFVAFDAIDEDSKPVITAYLGSVFATGKGERLASGRGDPGARFRGYAGSYSDKDPTGGQAEGDGEVPDWMK